MQELLSRVFRAVTCAGVCAIAGCAVGAPSDVPCATDADCPAGKQCDVDMLICVAASFLPDDPNSRVAPNSTPNNAADMGENNATNRNTSNNTTAPPNNSTNNMTTPSNNTTTNTNNNTTVDPNLCTPACVAPRSCVGGTCVLPDCAAVGDECDPARPDQNGFSCLDVDGDGVCAEPCTRAGSPDICAMGEYCVTYQTQKVCLPSFCDTNADCTAGTCLDIDNGFNFCVPHGALAPGAACDPADDQCPVNQACDPATSRCESFCDPFASGECGAGHFCAPGVTPRTGLCTHDLITNPTPRAPFLTCDPVGAACDNATTCWNTTTPICLAYCRAGMNDCSGVQTPQAGATVCDEFALYYPGLGVCLPPCNVGDCGTTAVCVNQLCRVPCTPGNELADCCDGQAPCPAYCNNNYCE